MATLRQIKTQILSGDYPASDLYNDCIENGGIEDIFFDLELERILYGDFKRSALLHNAIDYLKELFPLQYWQYRQLGRGPYQYKFEKGVLIRDERGLKVLATPPIRSLIVSSRDHDQLGSIYHELVNRKYIDGGGDPERTLNDFLNIFTATAPQGKLTWIKSGQKNKKEVNKKSLIMFLQLFKVPSSMWDRFALEIANIKYSDNVLKDALDDMEKNARVWKELKSIIG